MLGMKRTIQDIITACGGARAISEASQGTLKPIKTDAVYKWRLLGIHHDHWEMLIDLGGLKIEEIYEANRELDRKKRQRPNSRAERPAA